MNFKLDFRQQIHTRHERNTTVGGEKSKAAYPEVAKLDNDALRAKTEELKAYIHDSAAEQRAKVEELKASVEDTELEKTRRPLQPNRQNRERDIGDL